jgi:hypothetical protein
MEAASKPDTFGLASRIRPIFYLICVLLQDNSRQKPMTDAGIGPAISTAHGCHDRQVRSFAKRPGLRYLARLDPSTIFDGRFASDATTLIQP